MNLKLIYVFSSLLLSTTFLCVGQTRAPQSPFSIKGRIVDAVTNEPIEYATISVFKMPDSTLVTGTSAGAKGIFSVDGIQPGNYTVSYSFIGYKTGFVSKIALSKLNKTVDLGELKLEVKSSELDAVTVTGEKGMMLNKIDRKVFTIDKSITGQTGSVTDALQNIPSVAVDVDGNISLRGSENVIILINGKPSTMGGASRTAILQQLPANSVERIEVITNPSAKFESDGNAGIINIVMKSNYSQGFNGSATVNVGNQERANANVSLSYNPGKFNVFANYGIRKNYNDRRGLNEKTTYSGDSSVVLNQTSKDISSGYSHTARVGVEYNISSTLSSGINSTLAIRNQTGNERVDYWQKLYSAKEELFNRATHESEDGFNGDFAAFLQKKYGEGHDLRFDASYSQGYENEESDYLEKQSDVNAKILQQEYSMEKTKEKLFLLSSDYTRPLGNKLKLETGFKSTFSTNSQDILDKENILSLNTWQVDTNKSNTFKYNNSVHAVYGTLSQELGLWSYMVGLRLETAFVDSKIGSNGSSVTRTFPAAIPTIHLSQKWNENNQTQISYSRRARRPNSRQLNPFPDYSDPRNLRVGNPDLKPQYENNIELSYIYTSGRNTFAPTLFHKITENQFSRVIDSTSLFMTEYKEVNIKSTSSTGLELVANVSPVQFWNLNLNSTFFYYKINSADNLATTKTDNFNYSARAISSLNFSRSTALQITGFYRSPFISTQGESKPMMGMDLGLRQIVLNQKGTITLSVNDVFNSQRFEMNIDIPNTTQRVKRWKSQPTIYVGFTYRFGEVQKGNKQRERKNENSEMENVGEMM